ncbi:unnamed protein product [Ixodes persulcatus]
MLSTRTCATAHLTFCARVLYGLVQLSLLHEPPRGGGGQGGGKLTTLCGCRRKRASMALVVWQPKVNLVDPPKESKENGAANTADEETADEDCMDL